TPSEVCSGSQGPLLSLTGTTDPVVRWEFSTSANCDTDPGSATWTAIAHTATTYQTPIVTQTACYRAVTATGSCEAASDPALVIEGTTTQAGDVVNDITLCQNENSGPLTLTGHDGDVLNWEQSTNASCGAGVGPWTLIAGTAGL